MVKMNIPFANPIGNSGQKSVKTLTNCVQSKSNGFAYPMTLNALKTRNLAILKLTNQTAKIILHIVH